MMECKSEMWGACEHLCSLQILLILILDKLSAIQIQQLHAFPSVWNDEQKKKVWWGAVGVINTIKKGHAVKAATAYSK